MVLIQNRIPNKGKQRPADLVDPKNDALREMLKNAEYALDNADDVVNLDEEDDNDTGPASDSE